MSYSPLRMHYHPKFGQDKVEVLSGRASLYSQKVLSAIKSLGNHFIIITDDNVRRFIGNDFQKYLRSHNLQAKLFSFIPGEKNKTEKTLKRIIHFMHRESMNSDSCVIALGGGITTDLGGFAASIFCRGVTLINIPTSLIGMTDAAIGGKTGINVLGTKNLIGQIYHPRLIIIDPILLNSSSERQFIEGYSEILKYAITLDASLFRYLESENPPFDIDQIEFLIYRSCLRKIDILKAAKKQAVKRDILNFGHTIAHALETLTNHALSHGQAVKIGLITESFISLRSNYLSEVHFQRIHQLILKYGIMKIPNDFSKSNFLKTIKKDKKSLKNIPRFVILNKIGSCFQDLNNCCFVIKEPIIDEAYYFLKHALYLNTEYRFLKNSKNR
ncbi:MAG: 3-dehydroquinate synthase family protein [Victivallaceae bacterium]